MKYLSAAASSFNPVEDAKLGYRVAIPVDLVIWPLVGQQDEQKIIPSNSCFQFFCFDLIFIKHSHFFRGDF